jgi:hypothetical protein
VATGVRAVKPVLVLVQQNILVAMAVEQVAHGILLIHQMGITWVAAAGLRVLVVKVVMAAMEPMERHLA